jgi:alkylation response protein AidB-like acyl-CoA dehydrogenase
VDLSLSEDQLSVRAAFAEFFDKEATVERVRAAEPVGFDPDLWLKLAGTGAVAMGLPEAVGGGGASALDLVLVAEQYGRRLAPVPFVESAVAGRLLAQAATAGTGPAAAATASTGQSSPSDLIAGIADGSLLATIALAPASGGRLRLVPAGAVAEVVLALDGDDLIALRRAPGGRPHTEASPNFGSSPLADWPLSDGGQDGERDGERHGERIVLATGASAAQLYAGALAEWKLLTAAALGGLRSAALELGLAYIKARKAFGVIIGSFQAVQHRLADLAVAGDGGQLLTYEAAWARDSGEPGAAALASMAFLFAADCAFRTTRECLQFHGGYGFTLEYDIQLYFRRAKAWPLALGDPRREYARLADLAYPEG